MRVLGSLLLASLLTAVSVRAQVTDVDNSVFNEAEQQTFEGRLLQDGILYTGMRFDLGTTYNADYFEFWSDAAWYDFIGGGPQVLRRPYENITVRGNGTSRLLRLLGFQDPYGTSSDPLPHELTTRNIVIENATLFLDEPISNPNSLGAIDIRFSVATGSDFSAGVTLRDGILDSQTRQVQADTRMAVRLHGASGTNELVNFSTPLVANSIAVDVDPGASLAITAGVGSEVRWQAATRGNVDAATLILRGEGQSINMQWDSDQVNGLRVTNGGRLQIGEGHFSDRFEYLSNGPEFGIQVTDSNLHVASVATLEADLTLNNATVTVDAAGQIISPIELLNYGNSTIDAAPGKTQRFSNLEAAGTAGSLTLQRGDFEVTQRLLMVDSDLILGTPGSSAADTHLLAKSESGISPLMGRSLSGNGQITISNPATALHFPTGATLSPGHSLGAITVNGRLQLDSGSITRLEVDASRAAAGNTPPADLINLNPAAVGQNNLLDIRPGAQLDLQMLNDQVLPPSTRVILMQYPDASHWGGGTFNGFPDDSVVIVGQNHWRIDYDEVFLPGISDARLVSLTVVAPVAVVTPTHLDFPPTPVLTFSPLQTVTVQNVGGEPLQVSGFNELGAGFTVTGTDCLLAAVPAGSSCEFTVRFFPTVAGGASGAIQVLSNAPGQPPGLTLAGTGTDPLVPADSLLPTALNFGDVDIGATSAPQATTLTNTGNTSLTGIAIAPDGSTSADFGLAADNCTGVTLAVGASCTFSVQLAPSVVGPLTGQFVVSSNAPDLNLAVTGTGVGTPAVTLAPASIDFGNLDLGGGASPGFPISLSNTGTGDLLVANLQTSLPDYSISADSCTGATLAASASCGFTVQFNPVATGPRTAYIGVQSNAPDAQLVLNGNGVGVPAVATSPTALAFPDQLINTVSGSIPITVVSAGTADLGITGVSLASPEFSLATDTCSGMTLAPGGNCSIEVTASPTTLGLVSASLIVSSTAPQTVVPVSVNGVGIPQVVFTPGSLAFGDQDVGTTSAAQTVEISNPGSADLNIQQLAVGDTAYSISSDNCSGTTLAPGGTCQLSVQFSPQTGGNHDTLLDVASNANPARMALSGNGSSHPGLEITPPVFPLGNVVLGSTASGAYRVESTGDQTLAITAITSSNSAFIVSADACSGATLSPMSACQFTVDFRPPGTGTQTATIAISSNATPGTDTTVTANGTGVAPPAVARPVPTLPVWAFIALVTLLTGLARQFGGRRELS